MENSPLKWVAWETTRRCNLKCVHCRSDARASEFTGVGTREGFDLMDRVAEFARPVFVLSGGEPMLRDDIFELARHGAELGFRMAMATNGAFIDDEACESIVSSGIKMVSLSLDGPKASVHDEFRKQAGSYDAAVKAARRLKEHSIDFIINSSFTARNKDHIQATCSLARELGAKAWYMFLVVPMGRGKSLLDEMITPAEHEEILKWHYEAESREDRMLMRPTCAPAYYRIFAEERRKQGLPAERRSLSFSPGGGRGCVAARSIAYIGAEGDVYPCSYFPRSGGNLFDRSLGEIWDSGLFSDFRKDHGPCAGCDHAGVCGGCRARALAYNGDLKAADPYCPRVPAAVQRHDGL